MNRRRARLLALVSAESALLFFAGELIIALGGLERRLLAPLLYYQGADLPVHQASKDLDRHYELKPNASAVFSERRVSVNSLGFRGRERSREKPKGVIRIVCLGASNVYGARAGDGQDYPAALEKALNARRKGRYEVWNAGVSAYTLAQNVASAEAILRDYAPDMLIFGHFNHGRRPFLLGEPFLPFFDRDPGLYRENLRCWWPESLDFLNRSRIIKAAMIALNRALGSVRGPGDDEFNKRSFLEFYGRHGGDVALAWLLIPGMSLDARHRELDIPALSLEDRLPKDAGEDYFMIHPPAYVYAWYAQALAPDLVDPRRFRRRGLRPEAARTAGSLLDRAEQALNSGRPALAESFMAKTRRDRFSAEDKGRAAVIYQQLKRYEDARALLDELIAAEPRQARWRCDRGVLKALMGRDKEAAADFKAALRLDPGLRPAIESLRALEASRY